MTTNASPGAPRPGATRPVVPAFARPIGWCERCDAVFRYDEDRSDRLCGTCRAEADAGLARLVRTDQWSDPTFDAVWGRMEETR